MPVLPVISECLSPNHVYEMPALLNSIASVCLWMQYIATYSQKSKVPLVNKDNHCLRADLTMEYYLYKWWSSSPTHFWDCIKKTLIPRVTMVAMDVLRNAMQCWITDEITVPWFGGICHILYFMLLGTLIAISTDGIYFNVTMDFSWMLSQFVLSYSVLNNTTYYGGL